MAKAGAGKRKMAAQRKKQWNATTRSLKSTGRALRGGKRRKKSGCYVATCVYGSYDCPEVWVLRRFRDNTLEKSFAGRLFIKAYYAISTGLVQVFGNIGFFKTCIKWFLDPFIMSLQKNGVSNCPYSDFKDASN